MSCWSSGACIAVLTLHAIRDLSGRDSDWEAFFFLIRRGGPEDLELSPCLSRCSDESVRDPDPPSRGSLRALFITIKLSLIDLFHRKRLNSWPGHRQLADCAGRLQLASSAGCGTVLFRRHDQYCDRAFLLGYSVCLILFMTLYSIWQNDSSWGFLLCLTLPGHWLPGFMTVA